MSDDLTLHEAAEQLGVHYMTAYRYVRLGLLPADKIGRTWRVGAADLVAFRERSPLGRPGAGREWPDLEVVRSDPSSADSSSADSVSAGSSSDDRVAAAADRFAAGVADDGDPGRAASESGAHDVSTDGASGAHGQYVSALDGPRGVVRPAGPGRRRAPWAERLESRLLAGDAPGAWGVVEAALAAGAEPRTIHLDVISPAMASIGERWARGELEIAVEHLASGIAGRIIGRLGPRFVRRGVTRGVVVVGAPAGERHALPIAIIADLVRSGGWEVHDLGSDVPASSFARVAAMTGQLQAIGLSVTSVESIESARTTIRALRAVVPACPILLGGLAIASHEHTVELGGDGYAKDGRHVIGAIERLVAQARIAAESS